METLLFKVQDGINRLKYDTGLAEPEIPWSAAQNPAETLDTGDLVSEAVTPTATSIPATATSAAPESSGTNPDQNTAVTEEPLPIPTIAPSTTPQSWAPPGVDPFGDLPGEGVWQPYIYNAEGKVVATRTFLQPDPERPYALVAVVAFDLTKTRLHFVLGLKEPSKPGGPHGYGIIPQDDKQPGKLLAAFNGGFIAEHGGYGAMADGVVALAARAGLATLAIYANDDVRIGEWGNEFYVGEDYNAWRQNALMIIHNGEINPKVYTGTWIEWGANLDGATATLRSSVGLSEDNSVLYYFAGPTLSMPVLADAMLATGVYNGLLLDINPSHAHFTAMRVEDGEFVAEPLYEEVMDLWVDRYLGQWSQDFFYVTAKD
jgi:hypothetical protein